MDAIIFYGILLAALVAAVVLTAKRANQRAARAADLPRPISAPAPRPSVLRGMGTLILVIGLSALLWSCVAGLAIDPALGVADNLHWAGTRNSAMLWGFGLAVVGVLMRLGGRTVAPPAADQPTDRTHRRCPACAEPVLREAVKCKHCGEALVPLPYS